MTSGSIMSPVFGSGEVALERTRAISSVDPGTKGEVVVVVQGGGLLDDD
jgi:hypothetical protein